VTALWCYIRALKDTILLNKFIWTSCYLFWRKSPKSLHTNSYYNIHFTYPNVINTRRTATINENKRLYVHSDLLFFYKYFSELQCLKTCCCMLMLTNFTAIVTNQQTHTHKPFIWNVHKSPETLELLDYIAAKLEIWKHSHTDIRKSMSILSYASVYFWYFKTQLMKISCHLFKAIIHIRKSY
jgi:hypothetical protein